MHLNWKTDYCFGGIGSLLIAVLAARNGSIAGVTVTVYLTPKLHRTRRTNQRTAPCCTVARGHAIGDGAAGDGL